MLKLRARDAEDLAVVSACLQDAIVPVSAIAYLPTEQRFVFMANRFCWEHKAEEEAKGNNPGPYVRVHCGVVAEGITHVQRHCVDTQDRSRLLNLLAITLESPTTLLFTFSEGAALRVEGAHWGLILEDVGEAWVTGACPCHPLDNLDDAATGS